MSSENNRMDFAEEPGRSVYPLLREELGRQHPALWARVYPRAYRDAGDYHSPKIPATMLGHAVQAARLAPWDVLPPSTRQLYYAAARCAVSAPPVHPPRHMDVYPSRNVDTREHRVPATHHKSNACGDRLRSADAFR